MEIETRSKRKMQILGVNSIPDRFDVLVPRASSYQRVLWTIAWFFLLFRMESPDKAVELTGGAKVNCIFLREIATSENFILRSTQRKVFSEMYEPLPKGKPQAKLSYDIETLKPIWDAREPAHSNDWKSRPALKEELIDLLWNRNKLE